MADIKLIKKDTDLSKLKKPIGWDLVIHGTPYDVYSVDSYIHTIGGRWGENDYWACPEGEIPTYENLIQFSGKAPTWGVTFNEVNYTKTKWGETEIGNSGVCWITRNGENFYEVTGRDMSYALSKAQYFLVKLLEECPLYLSERNWKEQAKGMKIWYNGEPAIIDHVTSMNNLWVTPVNGNFKTPEGWEDDDFVEYKDGLVVDLLSEHITWYRD